MKQLFTLLLVLASTCMFAQSGILKGKIIHEDTKLPFEEVSVTLKQMKMITSTNNLGEYTFSNIPFGTYELHVSADGTNEEVINITGVIKEGIFVCNKYAFFFFFGI